ncbi:MAG: hypothetical protein ACTSQG_06285 [Promethearchaeota archaeon]
MKKIEMSKKITIEFTEKELISILTCCDDYFEWLELNKGFEYLTNERKQEINNVKNLVGIMKRWIF